MDATLYYDDCIWAMDNTQSLGNGLINTLSGGTMVTAKGGNAVLTANVALCVDLDSGPFTGRQEQGKAANICGELHSKNSIWLISVAGL